MSYIDILNVKFWLKLMLKLSIFMTNILFIILGSYYCISFV